MFSNLPLSSTQFPFVRAHDEFSLEISSDCFSFFFFFLFLSSPPFSLSLSLHSVPRRQLLFFHEMEVRWKPLSARELRRRGFFFFFFLEIYALTRQCKLSFPGADREISSPRFFECLGLHEGVGVAQLRVKLAKWLMHDEGCSS